MGDRTRYRKMSAKHFKHVKQRVFACQDCGAAPDAPMLKDEVWFSIAIKTGLLCCECTERRLGRDMGLNDLHPCLGNQFTIYWAYKQRQRSTL